MIEIDFVSQGYLTNAGEVNLDRVQMILQDLGHAEDDIFRQRQKRELSFQAREKSNKRFRGGGGGGGSGFGYRGGRGGGRGGHEGSHSDLAGSQFEAQPIGVGASAPGPISNAKLEMQKLRMGLGVKRDLEPEEDEDPQANDEVRLWEAGFKDRYYESKFDVGADQVQFRYSVALQYVKGLCWVLKYYYQGCASWDWYFPYHYAPFASDFVNISGLSTQFEKGTKPVGVFFQLYIF